MQHLFSQPRERTTKLNHIQNSVYMQSKITIYKYICMHIYMYIGKLQRKSTNPIFKIPQPIDRVLNINTRELSKRKCSGELYDIKILLKEIPLIFVGVINSRPFLASHNIPLQKFIFSFFFLILITKRYIFGFRISTTRRQMLNTPILFGFSSFLV